ncbi:Poly(U)-specific endoribonuclease-like protein [Frankliniella fusca]|uniref:Poly(U)-specific endoribonuclease-like protein n=1 Tax=Frankliniella fusca TaxID=407009 RepID=A0AAE1HKL1_9NEOP|nr:Poly(U)-specific endoribonuclease-like protein [Frankliniella fusca]
MKFIVLCSLFMGATIRATGLDPQPQTSVWKTGNSSRPWQNPGWASSTQSISNPVTQTPTKDQNSEWPSLSGGRQEGQPTRQPSSGVSYSRVVSPPNQRTESTGSRPSTRRPFNQNTQHRSTIKPASPVPLSALSHNRTQASDQELTALSEKLFDEDISNPGKNIRLNYQSRTQSNSLRDAAPEPLLTVDAEAFNNPTIKALRQLYDNYIADSSFVESITSTEQKEESEFLDKVLDTRVMTDAMEFLADKGYVQKNKRAYKDLLNSIWFTMYSRGGGIIGSSAFEHVFLGELKKDEVSGLHNWVYFANEEENHRADYMGYLKKLELGKKSNLLKVHYRWSNVIKPSGSMFVGTSPEMEMALYTVCFLTRPDDRCPMSLGGKTFGIQTYTYRLNRNRGVVIGSAYPVF